MTSDRGALFAIAIALVAGLMTTIVGGAVARRTGLLDATAGSTESIGVGLGLGLIVLASGYATLVSRGATSLLPIAIGLAAAVAVSSPSMSPSMAKVSRRTASTFLVTASLIALLAVVYGVTLAVSPRAGVQPKEFMDTAYYALLGESLRGSGQESIYATSGFASSTGVPAQTWYHWGEIWLGAAALEVPGVTALQARHLVVLPLVVAAAAFLGGAVTRRLVGSASTEVAVLGAMGTVLIAPLPLAFEYHFDWWATGLLFSVTQYGLVVVAWLLVLFVVASPGQEPEPWPIAITTGTLAASMIALHLAVAITALVGLLALTVLAFALARTRVVEGIRRHRRSIGAAAVLSAIAIAWGWVTGHGLGGTGASVGVAPFDERWGRSVIFVGLGLITLLAAPTAWLTLRASHPRLAYAGLAVSIAVVVGALGWGWQFASFNMFHLFFGALAVLFTPVAVAAVVAFVVRLRVHHRSAAIVLVTAYLLQVAVGAGASLAQLEAFGPRWYNAVPVAALDAIRALPPGAKLAYRCADLEEFAFWDPRLMSITAHTGRSVVPMCFQADTQRSALGQVQDAAIEGPFFEHAPQKELYPSASANPTVAAVVDFLRRHSIDYVYEDVAHPWLMPGFEVVSRVDDVTVYKVP